MKYLALLIINIALCGCAHQLAQPGFFPPDSLARFSNDDTFESDWYGQHLQALQELPIWNMPLGEHESIYRFLYLPSFGRPVCIRLMFTHTDADILITLKLSNGRGGVERGSLIYQDTKLLSKDDLIDFISLIDDMDFWDTPTHGSRELLSLDGSEYILEARSKGIYHIVTRTSPTLKYSDDLKKQAAEVGVAVDFMALEAFNLQYLKLVDWMARFFDLKAIQDLRIESQIDTSALPSGSNAADNE